MNLEGAAIKLLLTVEDRTQALDAFSDLRPDYFSKGTRSLYAAITTFYGKFGSVPTQQQLLTHQTRNEATTNSILSLEHLDTETLELPMVVDELKNQYTHLETMIMLEGFVHKSVTMDREEIIEHLSDMPLEMERKLQETFKVGTIANTDFFVSAEDHQTSQILSGISDSWDYEAGGYFIEDLVLFGGKRGSGKSLVCANMCASQHRQGNPSLYFTIEMTKQETLGRILCILAEVSYARHRKHELTLEEIEKCCLVMSSFFIDGTEVFDKYFKGTGSRDALAFQRELQTSKREKEEGKIIIVDDSNLTLATIDAKINTYKKVYGKKLKLVCVDYLNQVKVSAVGSDADMYDWKVQIFISKMLKETARKYKVCMVSPYQIDASGEARMSKGILDAADIAQVIHKDGEVMSFENVKARGVKDGSTHSVSISEVTLRIDPKELSQEDIHADTEEDPKINTWDLN